MGVAKKSEHLYIFLIPEYLLVYKQSENLKDLCIEEIFSTIIFVLEAYLN